MTVTSGSRTAAKQANAMMTKFGLGLKSGLYANKAALATLRALYDRDRAEGKSDADIEKDLATEIEKQMKDGVYISNHLRDRAADISTIGLSDKEIAAIIAAAKTQGAKVLHEGSPPHIHVQFP